MNLRLAYAEQRRTSRHSGEHARCTIAILRCGCGCQVCMKRRAAYYTKVYDAERREPKAKR